MKTHRHHVVSARKASTSASSWTSSDCAIRHPQQKISSITKLVVVATFSFLLSACSNPPTAKPAGRDPLAVIIGLCRAGEHDQATDLLLTFSSNNWLKSTSLEEFQLSEAQFVALNHREKVRLEQKFTDRVNDLKSLARAVVRRAQAAEAQGDDERAQRYIQALCQLGKELEESNVVLVLQLTGQSLTKTALPIPETAEFYTIGVYDETRDPFADLAETKERAEKEGKRILLQVGGNWCRPCKEIGQYMANNDAVTELLVKNFLVMKVTFPGDDALSFLSQYPKFSGYPHFFVLEKNGSFLHSQDTAPLANGEGYDQDAFVDFLSTFMP